ncbi:hypothetical protein B0G80_5045 [Paraburkholderia sp. BL6669N2]|uniref:alpha/beta hydrolase family protein n=1 Tax=Paraburkholderia sp. BL6669N2 TaxID=1938807 RepID=UPI000E2746C0|nr:hypothetical protein [Paraburkholderia sp. BL6669N2]REG48757.1 hypothetical protein B0G80_5045 [Paraburkholderia sp. BL6669N2]
MAEVPTKRLELEDNRFLSPPVVQQTLYQCAVAVCVIGYDVDASLDVEVNGTVVVSGAPGGFPQPQGAVIKLPQPLVAGNVVRARQTSGGVTSGWSSALTARDHTVDFPDGLPRPEINPAPVYRCGARTGVSNLLAGCDVWVTADGAQVGKVSGAAPHQGIDVTPDYGLPSSVRAWASLCNDPSPPSAAFNIQEPPDPLPAPAIDPAYEGTRQIRVTNLVNGARFEISRNGTSLGVWRTWGYASLVNLGAPLSTGDTLTVIQRMCAGKPASPPGGVTVRPCSALSAPQVWPVQGGDTFVVVTQMASGATIKVYVNHVKAGESGGPIVVLKKPLQHGDVVDVVQTLGQCVSQFAQELFAQCVAPPAGADPAGLDLFPVGWQEYDGGTVSVSGNTLHVRGSVYFPAEDDGMQQPFNVRRRKGGASPIVFLAHGNHSPADPSYRGYDYFQQTLAQMGIVAVSVDCNELNGNTSGPNNILDRADLINASIQYFTHLNGSDPAFKHTLDFSRTGLMGHSRGGEAVIVAPGRATKPAGTTIVCVLSLAPTDWGATSGPPTGFEFLTLLPAADGDVTSNDGAKYYDRCRPPKYKSQLYVDKACHNYFNRQWLQNDNGGTLPTMSRADHERTLLSYGCAFFRDVLAGQATVGFLVGTEVPPAGPTSNVHLAFKWAKATTVDDHQDGNGIGLNSMGQPTSQSGLVADEYDFSQTGSHQFNGSFYGDTIGMVAVPRKKGATFRSQLKGKGPGGNNEIWIRVADVFGGQFPGAATGFQLGIEQVGGTVTWVDSDDVGGMPLPFDRGTQTKSILSTLRFPLRCFGLAKRGSEVRAIVLRFNRAVPRALAFDDLQIV